MKKLKATKKTEEKEPQKREKAEEKRLIKEAKAKEQTKGRFI